MPGPAQQRLPAAEMIGARLAPRGAGPAAFHATGDWTCPGGGHEFIADSGAPCPLASRICPLQLTCRGRLGAANGSRSARAFAPRWQRAFPGDERELGAMRQWLASALDCLDRAARDDVASVATEFAANAIQHTASGKGGRFRVEVARHQGLVRVAVADDGAPGGPHLIDDPTGEHGRGLLIVAQLSVASGSCGNERGRLVWADIPGDGTSASAPLDQSDGWLLLNQTTTWLRYSRLSRQANEQRSSLDITGYEIVGRQP